MSLTFKITVDDQGNPHIKMLGQNAGIAETAIKKLGIAIAAAFTIDKIVAFGRASIEAYDESEKAATKLRTALGGTSDALLRQASALQAVTRFDDEAIVDAQALLATYGLSEKQILKLTPAILDFASATGTDMSSAAEKVGRSVTTSTDALKRNGIQIKDSTSVTERLDSALESLNKRFGGQAEAAGAAGAGGLDKLKNKFGDLQENVGRNITNFPLFASAVEIANNVLDMGIRITSDAADEYKQLADDIDQTTLPTILDLNLALADTISAAPQAGMVLGSIPKFADPAAIESIVASFKTVSAEADNSAVNISKSIRSIQASMAGRTAKGADKTAVDRAGGGKSNRSVADLFGMGAVEPNFGPQMESLQIGVSITSQKTNIMLQIMAEGAEKEKRLLEDKFKEQTDLLSEDYLQQIGAHTWLNEEKTRIDEKYAKIRQDIAREETAAKLGALATFFGGMASFTSQIRGMAQQSKALAIIAATIDTYSAANKALAAYPPPFGFIAMAGVVAAGLGNVMQISAQKFQYGGWPEGPSGTDAIPARVTKGERVLSRQEVAGIGGTRQQVDRAIAAGLRGGGNIYVFNNPVGDRAWFEDHVIPMIEEAESRRGR